MSKRPTNKPEPEPMSKADRDKLLDELAGLDLVDYEHQRKQAAEKMGVRAPVLDIMVKPLRELKTAGVKLEFMVPLEPWSEPVNGEDLVTDLRDTLKRYVTFSEHACTATALWIIFAHAHDAAVHSPILAIQSPTKRCGKTTLLSAVSRLVPMPLAASNVTSATLFRAIDKWDPTLCLDEADTQIKGDNEDLRGIVNSGHERTHAYVIRCVGDDHEPKQFSTWCPKAIALIGRLPPTLEDRSIVIGMERRLPSDTVERLPRGGSTFRNLQRKCVRWAEDNIEALRSAKPEVPEKLHDRARDNWEPLLAIAEACGWEEEGRKAALSLSGVDDDQTYSVQLLHDLRWLFGDGANRSSMGIVMQLARMEDRPWPEFNHGKPITTAGLARMLKPFNVFPRQVRVRGKQVNGYRAEQFKFVFKRYLPEEPSEPP